MTSRNWMFTINNPDIIVKPTDLLKDIKYCIYQEEKGENGTTHYQGYVELTKSCRLSALKKQIPKAHWETRKGTREQAITYCSKEETRTAGPWEIGDRNIKQGTRTDLIEIKKRLEKGESLAIIDNDDECSETIARYLKYFQWKQANLTLKKTWKTIVYVYHGEPGTGKSLKAEKENPEAYWKGKDIS